MNQPNQPNVPLNPNPFEMLQLRIAALEQKIAEHQREILELQTASRPVKTDWGG